MRTVTASAPSGTHGSFADCSTVSAVLPASECGWVPALPVACSLFDMARSPVLGRPGQVSQTVSRVTYSLVA